MSQGVPGLFSRDTNNIYPVTFIKIYSKQGWYSNFNLAVEVTHFF